MSAQASSDTLQTPSVSLKTNVCHLLLRRRSLYKVLSKTLNDTENRKDMFSGDCSDKVTVWLS